MTAEQAPDHAAPRDALIAASADELASKHPLKPGGVSPALAYRGEHFELRHIALDAGAVLPEHPAPAPILVHVIEGRVTFRVEDRAHELSRGAILHVAEGIRHDVTAHEPSRIIVTVLGQGAARS